ncbi:cyclic nucleotide-binding domain-containing protein, partial [bacterium]|nr:cyclic nucleotide-binding domain-containing protein [bacterium]
MSSGHPHLLEEFLDEYECSWKKGAPLEIHSLLDQWETEPQANEQTSAELLAELIMIGLEYSWRQHDPRQTEPPASGTLKYLGQELQQKLASADLIGQILIEEFRTRHRWGDRPTVDEYEQQYPEHVSGVRDELESLEQEYALETSIRKLFVESEESDAVKSDAGLLKMSISDFLAGVYPFSELPVELKDELAATALEKTFAPGDYLMRQGSASESLMVIMEGIAQVTIKPVETDETEQELARVDVYSLL